MTSNNSDNSDVGFIVLISFAVLALIPLVIGFDSFEELLRVGKIILIVVLVVTVVAGIIFGYLFYKRKIGKRNAKKEKNSNENIKSKKQRNVTEVPEKRNSEEIEIIDPIFEETNELVEEVLTKPLKN
ncbi:MAG: hypothetical protein KAR08_02860 [Candidatus Heimdallarchaeota archaeon]|nr:hypothetical protein [Candidatus Heimdallarchaeota archaeon]